MKTLTFSSRNWSPRHSIALGLIVLAAWAALAMIASNLLCADWTYFFKQSALRLERPYATTGPGNLGLANPPWAFLFLWPLAQLPSPFDKATLLLLSGLLIFKIAGPIRGGLVLVSLPGIWLLHFGQLDALLLLALMAPAWLAPIIVFAKPQGAWLAGLRQGAGVGWILLLATAGLSLIAWPNWFRQLGTIHWPSNASWFPYTVTIGLWLGWVGWREGRMDLLCWASLCFSPYHQPYSLIPAMALSARRAKTWQQGAALSLFVSVYVALTLVIKARL